MTGQIKKMGRHGHTAVAWDILDEASKIAAEAEFKAELARGATAFAIKTAGEPAEQIRTFDPEVEEIIIVAPMAGGAR